MARRVRTTLTIREDDPVAPRRHRSKKDSGALILVIVLVVLALFVLSHRTQRSGMPQSAAAHSRTR